MFSFALDGSSPGNDIKYCSLLFAIGVVRMTLYLIDFSPLWHPV